MVLNHGFKTWKTFKSDLAKKTQINGGLEINVKFNPNALPGNSRSCRAWRFLLVALLLLGERMYFHPEAKPSAEGWNHRPGMGWHWQIELKNKPKNHGLRELLRNAGCRWGRFRLPSIYVFKIVGKNFCTLQQKVSSVYELLVSTNHSVPKKVFVLKELKPWGLWQKFSVNPIF